MSQLSTQERVAAFLKKNPGTWFAKGYIADLARAKTGASPENVGRRLRVLAEASDMHPFVAERTSPEHVRAKELQEGGKFLVQRREKNHAWYCYQPPTTKEVREWVMVDGRMKEIIKTINT